MLQKVKGISLNATRISDVDICFIYLYSLYEIYSTKLCVIFFLEVELTSNFSPERSSAFFVYFPEALTL